MSKKSFLGRSIVSIKDLTREDLDIIFEEAKIMETVIKSNKKPLNGKILAALFMEPSTRTRLSFESAMLRLGGSVISVSDPKSSSAAKGESLTDTIRTVENYCDVIAMRHPMEGSARLAAEFSKVPILNGGSGAEEHPTQALLDLYTLLKELKSIEGKQIAMVGDLKYGRTVHSLSYILSKYKNLKIDFVSPPTLKISDEIKADLKDANLEFFETENLQDVISKVDAIYMTRIQKERFAEEAEYAKVKDVYVLNKKILESAKGPIPVLHPLPRVNEIDYDIDDTAHAVYFKQMYNGVIIRMALLNLILGGKI
ncbi:MAG: aspartate carbamoyltransferase [Candidatus Heimdallarchaeota archaeon]|nr:aspartate carbamoyltransferase [Candidatus Heimdallarchaeota archaeon]